MSWGPWQSHILLWHFSEFQISPSNAGVGGTEAHKLLWSFEEMMRWSFFHILQMNWSICGKLKILMWGFRLLSAHRQGQHLNIRLIPTAYTVSDVRGTPRMGWESKQRQSQAWVWTSLCPWLSRNVPSVAKRRDACRVNRRTSLAECSKFSQHLDAPCLAFDSSPRLKHVGVFLLASLQGRKASALLGSWGP